MADDTGPLTVEAATALLSAPRNDPPRLPKDEAPAEAAPEPEATDEILPPPAGDDDASEAAEPGDDVETEEQATVEAVDAPKWWDAEKKAIWATLSADQQAAVSDQEAKRETVVQKAKETAAAAKQQADHEFTQAQSVLTTLQQVVPVWAKQFEDQFAGIMWDEWAARLPETGPEDTAEFLRTQAAYNTKRAQLAHAMQLAEQGRQQAHQAFLREEMAKLPALDADLGHPEKGPALRKALGEYLVSEGVHPSQLDQMDAVVMKIAHKAKKYDDAQISLKAKPQTPPQRPALAPTAQPSRSSQQRSVEQLNARLTRSGSVEDAMALLQARRKG